MRVIGRLAWKQYRFELSSAIAAALLLAAIAAIAALILSGNRPAIEHLDSCTAADSLDLRACSDVALWLQFRDTELARLLGAMPFVLGVLLGSILVSREIEHRSAQLGWSLNGSRARWLAERAVPAIIVAVVLLGLLAMSGEALEAASRPEVESRLSLHEYGARGLPLVARGAAVFAVALLAGAITGRQLPALIVSGVAAVVLAYGLSWSFPYGAQWHWVSDAQLLASGDHVAYERDWSGFRAVEGEILTYDQALAHAPNQQDTGAADDWVYEHYEAVTLVLSGDQLGDIELRESLVLVGIGILSVASTLMVVDRRRPY